MRANEWLKVSQTSLLTAALTATFTATLGLSALCFADAEPSKAQSTPAPVRMAGYLTATTLPSSAALLPAPPAVGAAAMASDAEVSRSALAMHGTPRWELATRDAVLAFPAVAQTFSCALNLPIDAQHTPKLIALLRNTFADAGRVTSEAKRKYQRTRPFVANGKPICTPAIEEALRHDGSYPSGHTSIGWAFGLVLAEVAPDRANEVLSRGRAFGQSRLVCNVHWQSDVQAGTVAASAAVARMHAEQAFRDDVVAVRAEVDALRATGAKPDADCEKEAEILKSWQ